MAGIDRRAGLFVRLNGIPLARNAWATSATIQEPDLLQVPMEAAVMSIQSIDPTKPVQVQWEGVTAALNLSAAFPLGSSIVNSTGVYEAIPVTPGTLFAVFSELASAGYRLAFLERGPEGLRLLS